ncbi:hypothetical protein GGF42_004064 [Coemansia sp. RSA 2424]|nr:hypothetical protein GGF42_004064 [Coemansia sp. RSA 2424]
MSSPPKITLTMRLAPPLPPRKFLFVCHQKTIKELKNEIRRRLVSIIKEPVAITVNGYELMDDDDVVDVLAKDMNIVLHLAASLDRDIAESLHDVEEYDGPPSASPSPAPPSPAPARGLLMIRKREHGSKKGAGGLAKSAKLGRVYPAELAFEQASPAAGSSSDSDSDSGSSSDSDSDTSSDTSMHSNVTKSSSDSEVSSSDESDRRSVLESLPVSS